MRKYALIIDEETKACEVGLGTNTNFYNSIGMTEQEVEQAYDGQWYLAGYAPAKPEPSYAELRTNEYPAIGEQLDMLYWDKVNGTNTWGETIASIKAKYPKPVEATTITEDINNDNG